MGKAKAESFMAYVTDSLRLSPQGMYLRRQWSDVALAKAKRDDRSADEIIDDVFARFEEHE